MSIIWKKTLCIADKNDLDTLNKLENELQVDVIMSIEDCPDFIIDNVTGEITPHVKSICINGTQWNLVPGKNKVPSSIYDMLIASKISLNIAKKQHSPKCIGKLQA